MTTPTNLADLIARVERAETWRPVPGWPYEASDAGRLRRVGARHALRPKLTDKGYETVTLTSDSRRKSVRVHRAIYEAWHGPLGELTVNHINCIKTDNRPENLEACTISQNIKLAVADGLMPRGDRNGMRTRPGRRCFGSKSSFATLNEQQVSAIKDELRKGGRGARIAAAYGVTRHTISLIKLGKTWPHVA